MHCPLFKTNLGAILIFYSCKVPKIFLIFLHENESNGSYCYVLGFHQTRMMITWRERDHEEQNMISLNDPSTIRALRDCGLLKYFRLSGMRQQIELLEFLV